MRLAWLALSPAVVLLLVSACTLENSQKPATESDRSTGGAAPNGTTTAGSGTSLNSGGWAGGGALSGDPAIGGSGNSGGASPESGDNNAAGERSSIGGRIGVGGAAGFGGSHSAGSGSTSGTSNSAGNGPSNGGSNSAGNASSKGGSNSAGNAPIFGGSSGSGAGTGIGGISSAGSSSTGGVVGAKNPLPLTSFVFERKIASGRDHLVAMDFSTHEQRVITTLADGSVDGWNIDGVTVSPDRTRIVLASLYGPTAADNATGLATNRLWSLDTEGKDFRRLTPVFPNTHAGQSGWRIDVRDPAYSADGQYIAFDYGEGDFTGGYVAPWVTAADGSSLPSLFSTNLDCSVNGNAAFNPVTGDLLLEHVVCIGGTKGGFYLYPSSGGAPDYLVNDTGMSLSSEPPAFSYDGSIFVYSGRTYSDNIQSLYAYLMSERRVVTLVQGAVGTDIVNASFSPDNRHMVYCVRVGDAYDLRLLDLGADPVTDSALTNDGVSCDPVF